MDLIDAKLTAFLVLILSRIFWFVWWIRVSFPANLECNLVFTGFGEDGVR